MKQKDIAALVLAGSLGAIFSLIISKTVFSAAQKPTKVAVVQAIDASFPLVKDDPNYSGIFNKNALDPTQLIQITNNENKNPFNGSQ